MEPTVDTGGFKAARYPPSKNPLDFFKKKTEPVSF
jgi:hypothetical protein